MATHSSSAARPDEAKSSAAQDSHDAQQTTILFLMSLARALHNFGTPSHQLEAVLAKISGSLGIDAQFLVTPTSIQAAFDTNFTQTRMERVEPGETNLEKLTQLERLIRSVTNGRLSTAEAIEKIDAIRNSSGRYSTVISLLAFTLVSSTAALLFGGGWREVVVATGIGVTLGSLEIVMTGNPRAAMLFPAVAALFATVIARGLAIPLSPCVALLCVLSGLIVLVPGLTLTVAVNELANQHLVSGTARLMGALVLFLEIALGLALGSRICDALWGPMVLQNPEAVSRYWLWGCFPMAAAAFTILFRARPCDYFPILIASTIAFASASWGSAALGSEVGPAVGAFVLGTFSNVFARLRSQPAAITLLPGLLMLVPGSFGFKSLNALLVNDVLSGVEIGFAMALTAVSLVIGLLLANLIVVSRDVLY